LALTDISEAQVNPIFVRGKGTAYSYNSNPPAPLKTYVQGDYPPMMMTDEIGSGKVVASGVVTECRMLPASDNFVALMDAIFQWLSPGKKVLWFNGYGVYCTARVSQANCDNLVKKLEARGGYTISGSLKTDTITPGLLAPYDILVLPELQLPSTPPGGGDGGDPNLLPDADVQAVKSFVEGGKGLLIMSGSDFFGPSGGKGNYFKVMNKFLINLGFGWEGKLFGFQSDSVYDDVNNATGDTDVPTSGGNNYRPIVDVDTTHPIGDAYQRATGRTTFRAYGGCSLVQLGPGIAVYAIPEYQVGMPGETITYRVRVFNTGIPIPGAENVDLTIDLTVRDDSGWSLTLDNYLIRLAQGENQTVILSVTIPSGTDLCTEDEIIVTATAREYPVSEDYTVIAHAAKRLEVTADAYVTQQIPDYSYGGENALYIGRYMENWQYAYLMFDNLAEIPSGANIIEARLYLFCWSAYGAAQEMLACEVDDDWYEYDINWINKKAYGATLDTKWVSIGSESEPKPYYWDVTSFVKREFAGDKIASFCVRPADNCPPSTNRRFESREWWDIRLRPFLRVIYTEVSPPPPGKGVVVTITPASQSGDPGEVLNFSVTVRNTGENRDTFGLGATDTKGWDLTLENESITLDGGASRTIGLSIEIPDDAADGDSTTITVRAVGTDYENSSSCVARAGVAPPPPGKGVAVTITPASQSGDPGEVLNFSVTVTNTGTDRDTFNLEATDTEGWGPTLAITSTTLDGGAPRTIRLSIEIPDNAAEGDSTTITVTARGTGYENSGTCTATAKAGSSQGVSPLVYVGAAVVVVVIIAAVLIVKPF